MRRLALLVLLVADPAFAMTFYCGNAPAVTLWDRAQALPDSFVVLLGRLGTTQNLSSSRLGDEPVPPFTAPFDGHRLTTEGFVETVSAPITVVHACHDQDGSLPWSMCGELGPRDFEVLMFAREDAGGFSVQVGPCGEWAQSIPPWQVEEVKSDLAACAQGSCPAP